MVRLSLIIAVALLAFVYTSCESDGDSVNFPATLSGKQLVKVSEVKMYTGAGEVLDAKEIRKFIDGAESFNLPEKKYYNEWKIFFHSKDSMILDGHSSGFKVKKDNDLFLFYSGFYGSGSHEPLLYDILKYHGDEIYIPSGGFITNAVYVAHGTYRDLEMCFLAVKLSENTEWTHRIYWGTFINEFNPEGLNKLHHRDTLAVQAYRVKFRIN